ncbi:MAG: cation:proton antiporter [Spirochaetales bacterium]|nr:cation:proton antiporter [Spirochaetales bacterium]
MMLVREILALLFFASAVVFGIGGVVGLFRFPDPYSRLQAGSLAGTTAVVSVFFGALLLAPNWAIAARIIVIIVFFLISAPTGAHIVARFTWNSGLDPWRPPLQKRSGPDEDTDETERPRRRR